MKRGKMIAEILIGAASFGAIVAHTESRHRDSVRRTDETRVKNEELEQDLSRRKAEDELLRKELVSTKTELAALKSKPTPTEIYNRADWLAHIETMSHEPPILPIIPPHEEIRFGAGAMLRINDVLYILSANHVQRGKETGIVDKITVWIKLPGSIPVSAELYGWDPTFDLVLLRLKEGFGYNGPVGELQDSASLTPMSPVIAMGSPFMLEFSATYGYVTNTLALGMHNIDEKQIGKPLPQNLIHSAPLIPGHSGGPLVDALTGKIVGINVTVVCENLDKANRLYRAVPSEDIIRIMPKLLRGGLVKHGFISGIVVRDSATIPTFRLPEGKRPITEGVLVTQINPDMLGGKALHLEDLILGIDETPVRTAMEFMREIMHREPEDVITLRILREGVPAEVRLTLEEHIPN